MKYIPIYKCRLCGEAYQGAMTEEYDIAYMCMNELVMGISTTIPTAPTMTGIHHCGGDVDDGNLGLADFQGWKKEEKHD